MNTEDKVLLMFDIQNRLNTFLDEHWVSKNWNYRQALMVEAAEFSEHIGFKWWKKQTPDLHQAKLELVDMWHFIMSYIMAESPSLIEMGSISRVCEHWDSGNYNLDECTLPDLVMRLVSETDPFMVMSAFRKLCCKLDMTFEDLYKLYVGKSALNEFRWENGYGDGSYIKLWDGREDNEYLTEIVTNPETDTVEDLSGYIKKHLLDTYNKLVIGTF